MAPVQLFLFGLLLAWFVGSGKARALLLALSNDPPPSTTPGGVDISQPGSVVVAPSQPGGGGNGLPVGSGSNPAGPVLPGPLMPHG